MGQDNSVPSNAFATLFINIHEREHYPGEVVSGHVEIIVKERLAVDNLYLVLKGKQFTRFQDKVGIGKDREYRTRYGKRHLLRESIPLVTYSGNFLEKGYHKIEFHFTLPSQIPGSFFFAGWRFSRASIQYNLNAVLTASEPKNNLKFKRLLLITRRVFPEADIQEMSDEQNISSCCCFSKGVSKIRARFEQKNYFVDQVARALLTIDNSACSAQIRSVHLQLMRQVILKSSSGHRQIFLNRVADAAFPGIGAKAKTPENEFRFLELDLNQFVKSYLEMMSSYNQAQKYTGDFFLQPTTEGVLINCRYFVQIAPYYDISMQFCSSFPNLQLPITLGRPQKEQIPQYYPPPQVFSQPFEGDSYNHVLEAIKLNYKPEGSSISLNTDPNEPLLKKSS